MKKTLANINGHIKKFSKASLEELKSIKSPKQTGRKFIFSIQKLPEILDDMASSYQLLYINEIAIHPHTTIYYDTGDYIMYHNHQNGKLNRCKIRHKRYDVSKSGFLELKFKTNKGEKFKRKTKFDISSQKLEEAAFFLQSNSPFSATDLLPKIVIKYNRLTFIDLKNKERITCDYGLNITLYDNPEKIANLEHLCIIEVKRTNCVQLSNIAKILQKHRIVLRGLSKYCIGLAILNKELKRNRFKEKIRMLDKLKYSNA